MEFIGGVWGCSGKARGCGGERVRHRGRRAGEARAEGRIGCQCDIGEDSQPPVSWCSMVACKEETPCCTCSCLPRGSPMLPAPSLVAPPTALLPRQ